MQAALIKAATAKLKANLGRSLDEEGQSYLVRNAIGRRLVLTDIHGSFQTFTRLLQRLDLRKEDQLFILGDSINRAPYSLYVIEKIAKLLVEGYSIFPLRGNHEQLFLDFAKNEPPKLIALADRQYSRHLLEGGELPKSIRKFFKSLPYYFDLDGFYLVHAGFNTEVSNPFVAWRDMLWIRSMHYDKAKMNGKRVIHGHVPTTLSEITLSVKNERPEIKLDNGCIRAGVYDYGNLVCLDLDSGALVVQKNIDFLPA